MTVVSTTILSQGQFPMNTQTNSHWGQWVVTAATTSCANAWNTWSTASTTSTINYYAGQAGLGQQALSQQQAAQGMLSQAAMEQGRHNILSQAPTAAAAAAARRAANEDAERRQAAATRAKTLMRDNLTPVQREALDKHGWFLVEGGKSGKLYRVKAGSYAGNIYELDGNEREIARYCVHAHHDIPLYDHLLAQALSLRYDEDHIIGRANRTALRVAA